MPKWILYIIVAVLIVVDIAFSLVTMISIAPNSLYALAYGALGVSFVVIALPAKVNKKPGLWLLLITISTFLNTSAVLGGSMVQDNQYLNLEAVIANDYKIAGYNTQIEDALTDKALANTRLDDYMRQFDEDRTRETLNSHLDNKATEEAKIAALDTKIAELRQDIQKRIEEIEGEAKNIKASDLINAIPNAATSGRIIDLCLWLLVFLGLQWGIVASAEWMQKKPEEAPAEEKAPETTQEPLQPKKVVPKALSNQRVSAREIGPRKDPLVQFVSKAWANFVQGRSRRVVPRETFLKRFEKAGVDYDPNRYDEYRKLALDLELIDLTGLILYKGESPEERKQGAQFALHKLREAIA